PGSANPITVMVVRERWFALMPMFAALRESARAQVFGRRHPRCQPRAPAAGVRKAPRHEIAVGGRRRCRNYGDFAAGSGLDVVERGGNVGNFARGMCVN